MQNTNKKTEKEVKDKGYSKKYWGIHSKEGTKLEFLPVFEPNKETGDIEARFVEMKFTDTDGKEQKLTFNWLDIYMFMYFTCNEELRKNLAARYERQVNYIPYDVTVQCTPEEKESGIAKRRIQLPVDELTMAIARNEAHKLMMMSKTKKPINFRDKGKFKK